MEVRQGTNWGCKPKEKNVNEHLTMTQRESLIELKNIRITSLQDQESVIRLNMNLD
jgi:hypothetical protein